MRTSIYQCTRKTSNERHGATYAPIHNQPIPVLPGTSTRRSTTQAHAEAEAEKGVSIKRAKVFHSGSAAVTPGTLNRDAEEEDEEDVEEGDFPFSERQVRKTALQICAELKEENEYMVTMVCQTVGNEEAMKLLKETQAIEAQGGMMTQDKSKRKAPGGVFLALVKKKIGRFEFNELSREANRERKRLKALRIAEGLPPSSGAEQPAGAEVSGVQA